MGRPKFSEEQITFASRQHEAGTPVADVCRQIGASEATFYIWKKKYANLGVSVAQPLERWVARHGAPTSITVDHGTEFTSKALEAWAWHRGVKLDFIHPGKPTANGHIESFNGRLRDECLIVNQFMSLDHATELIEAWRIDYNTQRPHGSLGHLTPSEYVAQHGFLPTSHAANF